MYVYSISINQSNFYSANIPGEARLSGATAESYGIVPQPKRGAHSISSIKVTVEFGQMINCSNSEGFFFTFLSSSIPYYWLHIPFPPPCWTAGTWWCPLVVWGIPEQSASVLSTLPSHSQPVGKNQIQYCVPGENIIFVGPLVNIFSDVVTSFNGSTMPRGNVW